MKIAVLSYGTRGDVQPYVALTRALVARGHDAWLAGPEDARSFIEGAGLAYRRLAGDARALLDSEEGRRLLASGNVLAMSKRMVAFTHSVRDQLDEDLEAACAGADLVVAHMLVGDRAASVCERHGQRCVMASTFPIAPTRAFTNPLVDRELPTGFLKRSSHLLVAQAFYRLGKGDLDHFRNKLGLKPVSRVPWDSLRASGVPVFFIHSAHMVPRPDDWDPQWQVTGQIVPDAGMRAALGERAMSEELSRFIDEGPPPFFIGFGSMPVVDPAAMMRMALQALEQIDGRAIIGAGWSRLPADVASPRVCLVGAVDHDTLLPRCAGMVHHGGAGTTTAALRAGIPAAVLSVFGDQPFWGRTLEGLGAGVHRRFTQLDARVLASVLQALRDEGRRARARELGEKLRAEDGTANLVAQLEAWSSRAPVPRLL